MNYYHFLLAPLVWTLMFIPTVSGCYDTATLQTTMEQCKKNDNQQTYCQWITRSQLTIPSEGEGCLLLKNDNGTVVAMMSIRIETFAECVPVRLFETSFVNFKVQSTQHCPGFGGCTNTKCADTQPNDTIQELSTANNFHGNTYCMESCGHCVCLFGSGCLFYRVYAEPRDGSTPAQVFNCGKWEYMTRFVVKIDSSSHSITRTFDVVEEARYEDPQFAVELLNMKPLSEFDFPTSTSFISNGTRTSWLDDAGLKQASFYKCYNNTCEVSEDTCICRAADSTAACSCRQQSKLLQQWDEQALPSRLHNELLFTENKKIRAHLRTSVTVQVDSIIAAAVQHEVHCSIMSANLSGCTRCAMGAQFNVSCFAVAPVFGHITCGSLTFGVPCTPDAPLHTLTWYSNSTVIHEDCTLKCARTTQNFEVAARLKTVLPRKGWISIHGVPEPNFDFTALINCIKDFATAYYDRICYLLLLGIVLAFLLYLLT